MSIADVAKIHILKMTVDDIENVVQIEAEAYGEHHWSKSSFYDEMQNNLAKYYVARNERGELLGYLGAWLILDEAHITTLAVSSKFRRNKVAQSLLFTFIEDCYKNMIKYITLEVRVSNEPAIQLYTKFGFNSFGTRKKYYQDNNEDALIMWTENIWYEKFKTLYEESKELIKNVEVCFEQ